jgi:hypothetical protein
MRPAASALAAGAIALLAAGCGGPDAKDAAGIDLLDADHAGGWKHIGGGGFKIEGGQAATYGGRGVLYFAARPFADFLLTLEFMQESQEADSGVFVRFPDPGGDPAVPAEKGYQVEIGPVLNGTNQGLGAIDNVATPINDVPARPAGQWNTLQVRCVGQSYAVSLNGRTVTRHTGDRSLRGYVGLQNHDGGSIVHFRNIRIRELGP